MTYSRRERWLLGLFLVLILPAFGGLIWRLFDLQYYQKETFDKVSRRQQNAVVPDKPRRGLILDSRGRVLAASVKTWNAFAEPRRLREYPDQIQVAASALRDILNMPGYEICRIIEESRNPGYVKLKAQLTPGQRDLLSHCRLAGIGVEADWIRQYPAGSLTSHLLGFVGAENTGLSGLELQYENILAGQPGQQVFIVDAQRRPIGTQMQEAIEARDGLNLVLTIDSVIQHFTREALLKKMTEYQAESAVAMVMDPWTGAVLAMVSLPDYDPAAFSTTPQDRMRNRILTDSYEPGSIFKPIVAAIALDAGSVGFNEKFDCENGYWPRYRIGEFGNHQYGIFSVREILIHSSNIGMAKIGLKMGQKELYKGLKLFGFSEQTGIDLPGEEPGLLRPLSQWSGWSVTRIPFGHEISVTGVQICRAYSILANGGYMIKPHIVRAVVDNQGTVIENKQPPVRTGYILKSEVAQWIVRNALVGVVNEGTGDQAKMEQIQVWGKTGTANIALSGGGYDTRNYVASFVGGAPADKPAVVVLVSIRKPNRALGKGYSGGRVAAPVVKEILENTLTYLGIINSQQLPVRQVVQQ
ncbi:MAG TPA: penicillin-binding protein 2 [Anaerohalosphaeraceae bacterium]|nr:penicillin-binding protein 2 [Anaerohalosphaeraceae bacterium]HOL31811.1 penicillin-binding protein 2 [Anaerohalosphaeraceae bacterium]HOM75479.1 penicillin-binding protein 2 [Anaerohalosphaeraceae bacterium]HPC63793.1 penicillin-binding protein 2 [Anaerohalosphaeraceae bacterium]HPO70097.1 penicillin-binding protein 2 [Anaerohalosphaeraceae bacterium]